MTIIMRALIYEPEIKEMIEATKSKRTRGFLNSFKKVASGE
jgi:hypothetical protein